jgi:hypothetical protein
VLRWFTANIGIHHVHHLSSRIPCYRLGEALRDHPELREVSRLTLMESFRCLRLALWDEDQRRLVEFREARARLVSGSRNHPIRASSSPSLGAAGAPLARDPSQAWNAVHESASDAVQPIVRVADAD